ENSFVLVERRNIDVESVPEAEQNPAILEDARFEIRAGGKRDLFDARAVAVHYKERLGALLMVFFEIAGAVGTKNNSAIGQVCAAEVIKRSVGKLCEPSAIDVNLVLVKPVLIVAAHGEEDFFAVERRLR